MDIRTLYASSCIVSVLLAAGILCLAWSRPQVRYVRHWAAGDAFYTLGTLGVAVRGVAPDWISIVVSNTMSFLAIYLWLEGFQTLTGTRRFTLAGRLMIGVGAAAIFYFWAWDDNLTSRIVFGSAVAAIMLGFVTVILLSSKIEGVHFPMRISAGVFGSVAGLFVVRIVFTVFQPAITDYLAAPWTQSIFLIPSSLGFIAENYVFLWLVIAHEAARHAAEQSRLLSEVEATRQALEIQAVDLRRAKIDAEAASATKSTFLATMSHEIRTPLNGVLGFADLLLGTKLEPVQRRYVEVQKEAGHNLLNVINDILDFSKLEAGKYEIEPVDVDVWALLESGSGLFRPAAQEKRLELRLAIDPSVPRWASLDGQRLRQVISNLLSNAIKFTKVGGVTLAARQFVSDGGSRFRFEVRDTGIGISADKLHKLFQDFSQVDGSTSREFGGTGLGLAISRRLIGLMGGELGVETALGEGSNFWIEIPYRPTLTDYSATNHSVRRSLQQGGLHILVAEEAPLNQEIIGMLLKRFGHQIKIVGDGAAAVDAAKRHSFDLILMDLHLPEIDGIEATRQIRDLPGEASRVPIIALTASALPAEIETCHAVGMQGHLVKPIDPDRLMDLIDRMSTDIAMSDA
jgi:signal transduction histidine kinase/ActR/RegA family two-component response regulator